MASREQELAIKIAGKVDSSLKSALGAAGTAIKGLSKTMATVATASTAAIGSIATASINVGREFEGAMSQVQATMLIDKSTEEGKKSLETLENAARECGATTAFSATEAAEGLNYLALAGYDADKAAAALPTVLKLAGAGAMDLASASDMITDSMSALNIEATQENLSGFADQMAQTASKSNTSVSQLGEAILTVGATASNLAGGTTELNTALGILANNGIKSAEGGTHLRNVILSLQSPTDNAAEALDSLGISVYDAQGNMRGLNDIFGDLNKSMDGMTQAQKDDIIGTIFNKTDLTSANALLASMGDTWDGLYTSIENAEGACQDMYDIQLDNLDGDIAKLQSGLSDLGISIYKDLNEPLRSFTQLGSNMVSELSKAYQDGGMEAMVGEIGNCLSQVVDVVADYVPMAVEMGMKLLESFLNGISQNSSKIAQTGASMLTILVNGVTNLLPQVILTGIDILLSLADGMAQEFPTIMQNGTTAIQNFVQGITNRIPELIRVAITLAQTLASSIVQNAPMLVASGVQLIGNLALGFIQMLPTILQIGIQMILNLAQGMIQNLPLLLQMAVQIVNNLVLGLHQMLPTILQGGIQLLITLIQGIAQNLPQIIQSAIEIVGALVIGLIQAIPQLIAGVIQLVQSIIETICTTNWLEVGANILNGIKDGILNMASNLGSSIKDSVLGLFGLGGDEDATAIESGASTANSYASGITSSSYMVTDAMSSMTTSAFSGLDMSEVSTAGTTTATAFTDGLTEGVSSFTFDTSLMNLDSVATTFNSQGLEGMTAMTEGIQTGLPEVQTAIETLSTTTTTTLDSGWESVKTGASTAMDALKDTVTSKANESANAIKSAFENLHITIPKPSLPVIDTTFQNQSYGNGGNIQIPQFSVHWNALGGIFDRATVFGTSQGLQGAGEAGAEALIPLDTLWNKLEDMFVKYSGDGTVLDGLLEKLSKVSSGSSSKQGQIQFAGTGGITYAPTFHIQGSANKEDIVEAEELSQAKFAELMERWQRENDRKRF